MNITDIVVHMYAHNDEFLWSRIGKYFADKKIRSDLGGPLSSDEEHSWWIAELKGKVAGFASVERKKDVLFFRHAYVLEPFRGNGVYSALLRSRLQFAKSGEWKHVTAYCTAGSKHALESAGFKEIGTRGKYFSMRMVLR